MRLNELTIRKGEDDDNVLEKYGKWCKIILLDLKKHSGHEVLQSMQSTDGLWSLKARPCECITPRFSKCSITVVLDPLPIEAPKASTKAYRSSVHV